MNKIFLLLFVSLILAGCLHTGSTLTAAKGDTVSVDYVGSLTNGQVFDTSVQAEAQKAGLPARPSYEPLNFTVGAEQMIKGFDDAVIGMKVGEEKTVTLPPEQAYGQRNEGLIVSVPRDRIQGDVEVGATLQSPNGQSGKVTAVDNQTVTVDFNHQLAGQTLVFKITLQNISRPSQS